MADWHQIEGNWKQLEGELKKTWGRLTDDDLEVVEGYRDVLVGRLQERYGWERSRAVSEVDRWRQSV